MIQARAKVIKNIVVTGNYYKISIASPRIAREAKPGQFLQVKVNNACEPLLRRPLGIHRIQAGNIEILYEVVGPATAILAQKKTGEYISIIGPLGNGFSYDTQCGGGALRILVAGGMGVAPIAFLAEKLKELRGKTIVLIGARSAGQVICEREFKKCGCQVEIATDDGSRGFHGRVTDLLKQFLRITNHDPRPPALGFAERRAGEAGTTIYACGPRPMLKEIGNISKTYHLAAQVSLEEHMACGIGACLGCAVNTSGGYKSVCKDGPVFDAQEIIFDPGF